jgi:hypothetical protein
MTLSLLTMVPTRWRRENCERQLKSFRETTDSADLLYILDDDDQDTYEDMDWGNAAHAVLKTEERVGTTAKVNYAVSTLFGKYDAFMYIGDDHLFSTPHWDTFLMGKLEETGGTGMLYGDDKRRIDIPETVIISADIINVLGHFAEPMLTHYYIDNVWAEIGKRAGLLRYYPEVVFEHLHYQIRPEVEHDQTYRSAETMWGQPDSKAYQEWFSTKMSPQASLLRREFNPDVKWVTSII